ncbi:MAG: aminotransferase class V-fold PLP-dependent enzyme [Thermoanaerobaculia bacterium]
MDPELRAALRRKRYDAVTMAHNETSTGVLQPVETLARVVREESEALVLVDAVSSLAGARLETDAWDLDFVFAGSQKGLAAPPGLALFTFSGARAPGRFDSASRVLRRSAALPRQAPRGRPDHHRHGVDRLRARRAARTDRARRAQARWERHLALYGQTASWVEANGCSWASSGNVRSPTVSCLRPPAAIDAPAFVRGMKARGFTLGGGYGRFKDSTFRIGHMGEVQSNDLAALFAAMEEEIAA